ncbi:MAG: bifunctional DNA primase/polymerase [Phycisphaeraceae bacterium]|nr:bifunctional DNA primase/polymerase [Phycisphaeraceae bacterium]
MTTLATPPLPSPAPDPTNPLLEAALAYAARGWPVFPLHKPTSTGDHPQCSCGKADCPSIGKHPRTKSGLKNASNDPAQIRSWWSTWPDANIGVCTGPESGLVVLDVDPRHDGDKTLAALVAEHGDLPATVEAATGGGGQHYLFKHPGGKVRSRNVAEGLDCKGDGGYIVVGPSLHASGNRYQWVEGRAPGDVEVAEIPAWLQSLIDNPEKKTTTGKRQRKAKPSLHSTDPIPDGQRSDTLISIAGTLRRQSFGEDEIREELLRVNAGRCVPPMSDDEVASIAASAAKYEAGPGCPYKAVPAGLVYLKPTKDGPVETQLTNFSARIIADVTHDDGVETARRFEIEGRVNNGAPVRFTLPAEKFYTMNWHVAHLGARAVVFPGHSAEAHARTAIQQLSPDVKCRTVYGHTGWREIDGKWVYLHAAGAIGAEGLRTDVQVELTGNLAHYELPAPPDCAELESAVKAVVCFLLLEPSRVCYPVVAAVIRAILGGADFSLFLVGRTGAFKSEIAALVQQFFGPRMGSRNLPAGWSSTANSLEDLSFRAKDAIFVVDDFKPSGENYSDAKLHQAADRLLRAQGNGSGRSRMTADCRLRAVRPPRGLIIATGEDLVRGESVRARLFILQLTPGDIDGKDLQVVQDHAAAGRFAAFTSAFCMWMAGQRDEILTRFKQRVAELRPEFAAGGGHARNPIMLAELQACIELLLRFVAETTEEQVVSAEQAERIEAESKSVLIEAAEAQAQHQRSAEPTQRYLELLASAIASGRAHLARLDGSWPTDPQPCGWRRDESSLSELWRPMGERIGYIDGDELYLNPDAAYRVAKSQGGDGESIAVSERTLRVRLNEKKLLASTDPARKTLTVRVTAGGSRPSVLHIKAHHLLGKPGEEIVV